MIFYILPALFLIQGYFSFHPELSSVCSFGGFLNCGSVLTSEYAAIMGAPLWALGLVWSVAVILRKSQKDYLTYALKISGLIGVIYSLVVMALVIKSWCTLCLMADVLIIIYLLKKDNTALKKKLSGLPEILISLVVGAGAYYGLSLTTETLKGEKITLLSSPLILGNPQGSKEVVVFTDFQCPACAKASDLVRDLLKDPAVKVLIKHYPLSDKCNDGVSSNIHSWACDAAKMAYCSFEQDRFKEFYDMVYAGQSSIESTDHLYQLLDDGSFNIEELRACVEGATAESMIAQDIDEGNKTGIEATPTFFFNGQQVLQWNNPHVWELILK